MVLFLAIISFDPAGAAPYSLLQPIEKVKQANTIVDYVTNLVPLVIMLAAVLAVVQIVIGGMEWALSESITGKGEGKDRISMALLGLFIALLSYLILNTINPDLVNLKIPQINTLNTTATCTPACNATTQDCVSGSCVNKTITATCSTNPASGNCNELLCAPGAPNGKCATGTIWSQQQCLCTASTATWQCKQFNTGKVLKCVTGTATICSPGFCGFDANGQANGDSCTIYSGSLPQCQSQITSAGQTCNNGVKEGTEQCDLGAANNGVCPKTCSSSCTTNSCSASAFNYQWMTSPEATVQCKAPKIAIPPTSNQQECIDAIGASVGQKICCKIPK